MKALMQFRFPKSAWPRLVAGMMLIVSSMVHAAISGATGGTYRLTAKEGSISAADGMPIYNWGYALNDAADMQYPGPTLIVEQGAVVTVSLVNRLKVRTSIVFPGQKTVNFKGGVDGPVAREARPGETVVYSFVAGQPGTYMYYSGTQMDVQQDMGLFGTLIIRPKGAPAQAYEHVATRFDREHLFVLSEIDPVHHDLVQQQVDACPVAGCAGLVNTASFPAWQPAYWFINGRTAPDTMAAAGTDMLPTQPYNSVPRMHPGEKLLMRMVNAGRDLHPFHHHGNHTHTIGRDGRMLSSASGKGPDLAQSDFTLRMVPGETVDAIYEWTGKGLGWDIYGAKCDPTQPASATNCPPLQPFQDAADQYKPFPVTYPNVLEVTYGDKFSGSPFLGNFGERPVGAGRLNTTGAFFHMMHSHNERELLNNGIFPGGMMTFVIIEAWNVQID